MRDVLLWIAGIAIWFLVGLVVVAGAAMRYGNDEERIDQGVRSWSQPTAVAFAVVAAMFLILFGAYAAWRVRIKPLLAGTRIRTRN